MSDIQTCPVCAARLAAGSSGGACPRCMMGLGLDAASEDRPGRTPPSLEEVASRFPGLEPLEIVGQGGMGVVYRARQVALDRVVALKILWPELGANPAFAERFTREARALARFDHPNIVRVHESGSSGDWLYLAMEFVEGSSLRALMDQGEVSPPTALAIVPQICEALQYAHDHGVVHRDIKPANVLLDRAGRVKLVDFGLAKLVATGGAHAQLTQTHQVMGTLHYMAPEQYRTPHDIDHRADIYSLGVVFYEMLTGELPVGRVEPPSRRVQVDVRLDEIVLRSLEREREKRYQRASHVGTAVTDVTTHPPGAAPAAPEPARSSGLPRCRAWLGWSIAALVFLPLGTCVAMLFTTPEGGQEAHLQTVHVSGGPASMPEEQRQEQARRIVEAWRSLVGRLRTRSAMDVVQAEGEAIYGPDGMAILGRLSSAEIERRLEANAGALGVPLLRDPLGLPPLWDHRVVAVRFRPDPDAAKVAVEAGRHHMWFRMHQQQGTWYFDVAAVWRGQLPDPDGVPEVRSLGDAPPPSEAELREIVTAWERLRKLAQGGPLAWEDALALYTPQAGEALAGLPAQERDLRIGAGTAGAPLLRTEPDAPPLAAHRVWTVTSIAPDEVRVRAGFREHWTVSVVDAILRKVDGTWSFTLEGGYGPPKDW